MSLQDVFNQFSAEQSAKKDIKAKIKAMQAQEQDWDGQIFPVSPWVSRLVISVDDTPVSWKRIMRKDRSLRFTTGNYALCYKPSGSNVHNARSPFVLWTDVIGFKVSVCCANHLRDLAAYIPEVGWLLRNTTFCDELFDIARKHAGVPIPFSLKVDEYVRKLEAQGIKDDGIFFSHRCSEQDFEKVYQYKYSLNYNNKDFYKKVVKEVESRYDYGKESNT